MDKAKLTRRIIDTTNAVTCAVCAHKIREGFAWEVLEALRVGASTEDAALIDALLVPEEKWSNADDGVA